MGACKKMLPRVLLLIIATIANKNSLGNDYFGDAGFESDGTTKIPARFDYRQTFKYPFYTNSKTAPEIPYFNKSGDVLITNDLVRIAPSLHNKMGLLWCETANSFREWMVEFSFQVQGRGASGGEGFVIWYAKDLKAPVSNPDFYGSQSKFEGVAVVFDSADVALNRHNPFIYAISNDGTKTASDFPSYASASGNLGSCFREYRNTPGKVWAKLKYDGGILSLGIDIRQNGKAYTDCFKVPVSLPAGYNFGISALTSNIGTDDHDMYSFETYQLRPPPKVNQMRPQEEKDIREGKAFKMNDKLQKKIEEYEQKVANEEASEDQNEMYFLNPESISRIEENQFHILEGLNLIESKLGVTPQDMPTGQEFRGSQSQISDDLKSLRNELKSLQTDLRSLHSVTTDLKKSTENLLQLLDKKVSSAGEFLLSAHQNSSAIGTMVKVVAFFVAICFALILYSTCIGGRGDKAKKFV